MKKSTLCLAALLFVSTLIAQEKLNPPFGLIPPQRKYVQVPPQNTTSGLPRVIKESREDVIVGDDDVSFIKIGEAQNVFGLWPGSPTTLWADPVLNSVVHTHQLGSQNELGYDVSIDGGNSWTTDVEIYPSDSLDPPNKYPQGGLLNPDGNTDPDLAYYTYLFSTSQGGATPFGGNVYGLNSLTDTISPDPTQSLILQDSGLYRAERSVYTITQQGVFWYVSPLLSKEQSVPEYTGNILIGKGELTAEGEIDYSEMTLPFLNQGDLWTDMAMAFSPDGETGYICMLSDPMSEEQAFTKFHPVFIKTTNGGESWSDPIHVQLGGENGIESLKDYFTDEAIENAGYDEGFDRDEVYYNMGWSFDMITDSDGNPYFTGIIAIADDEGWYPYETQMATWNLFSTDGGETWEADGLYDNIHFAGSTGTIIHDNHPYVSSSHHGDCLFFSWLDTELDSAEENNRPNMYLIGYSVEDQYYSEIHNVSYFTEAWNRAFFGSQSNYIFTYDEPDWVECEIPIVYVEFVDPDNDAGPVNFWYVDGYDPFLFGCPCNPPVGSRSHETSNMKFNISQNFPNPANDRTEISVTVETHLPIKLSITNLAGLEVYHEILVTRAQSHVFNIDVSDFPAGFYIYSISVGDDRVSKKMVVR